MTDSIFRDPKKLQFIDTSKEKDTLNPNLLDNSDPTLATNYTGNNELDIPFTPRSFLMSNLGIGGPRENDGGLQYLRLLP